MQKNFFNNLKKEYFHEQAKEVSISRLIGIEREALRIDSSSHISKKEHPKRLGSALLNKYITTDFSEALIEMITPPEESEHLSYAFLENIHHFTASKIGNERLWPLSMPPIIRSEEDIRIARYGTSNLAKFKSIYRKGLGKRYGRPMQAIAGIHFNFSFLMTQEKSHVLRNLNAKEFTEFKNEIYLGAIRNLHRINWLILFLFGASPIMHKSFSSQKKIEFKSHQDSLYLPHATSLRMSDIGYQPVGQSKLYFSLNSISEYSSQLKLATKENSPKFHKTDSEKTAEFTQLNSNILQIEDEYYGSSRPKSNMTSEDRPSSKLLEGIDYIELRSIDIDPFSRLGIDEDTMKFISLLVLHCAYRDSPRISKSEMHEIKKNDLDVALEGRKEGLKLMKNNKHIGIREWGIQIIEEMSSLIETLGLDKLPIEKYRTMLDNQSEVKSSKTLSTILDNNLSFEEFGSNQSQEYKDYFDNKHEKENNNWSIFEDQVKESISKQDVLEKKDAENNDFEEYIKRRLS